MFKKIPEGARIITFEDELKHLWEAPKPSEDEKTDIRMIANSDQYKSLRSFLSRYAVGFYRDARTYRDNRTDVLNELGQELENIILALDSYKEKTEANTSDDPYDV